MFFSAVAAASLACLITGMGVYTISKHNAWGQKYSVYLMSFAAGLLVAVSFLHIVPKAFQMTPGASGFLLLGFIVLYLSHELLKWYLDYKNESQEYALGIIPALGVGFHSFIDGIIFAVTFNVSAFTGVLAGIGMIFHELPEGMVTYVLLIRGGFERKKAFWGAFTAAGFSTPLGTIIAYPFVMNVPGAALGSLLAFAAGALIYVSASHLLPEVEKEKRKYTFLSLAAGILVALLMILTKEHSG